MIFEIIKHTTAEKKTYRAHWNSFFNRRASPMNQMRRLSEHRNEKGDQKDSKIGFFFAHQHFFLSLFDFINFISFSHHLRALPLC